MKITSNISELIAKLERMATAAGTLDVTAALTIGVNTARGKMTNRIFNDGLDANLKPLGKYVGGKTRISKRKFRSGIDDEDKAVSKAAKKKLKRLQKNAENSGEDSYTEYEKKRLAEGRQIGYKDEEFTGETRRSIKTQQTETGVVAAFDNNKNAKIAQYQEEQIGNIRGGGTAKIFALSDEERDLLKSETNAALIQLYAGIFNS